MVKPRYSRTPVSRYCAKTKSLEFKAETVPSCVASSPKLVIARLEKSGCNRTGKKSNAPLFGLAEDNQDDFESVCRIVTDFGPELIENDTAITADDIVK
uniref:Uncharacterized protein n=1 Tax=Romanomermis culicivorax TaxID=13658 RepID=A0A915IAB4_ROMCU